MISSKAGALTRVVLFPYMTLDHYRLCYQPHPLLEAGDCMLGSYLPLLILILQ